MLQPDKLQHQSLKRNPNEDQQTQNQKESLPNIKFLPLGFNKSYQKINLKSPQSDE